jgi:hypothetical protein
VTLRSLPGSPAAKKPAEGDVLAKINEQDTRVLGMRIDFYHRGVVSFSVHPTAPIPVPGISKTISVWIAGRNFNHTLKVLIEDYFGRDMELTVGRLTFTGWKKLTVADEDAFEITRLLARNEGLFVGMSSGAAVAGALKIAKGMKSGTVVVLLPDRGDRYLSTKLFMSTCACCPP